MLVAKWLAGGLWGRRREMLRAPERAAGALLGWRFCVGVRFAVGCVDDIAPAVGAEGVDVFVLG